MSTESGAERLAEANRRATRALQAGNRKAPRSEGDDAPDRPARSTRLLSKVLDDPVTVPGTGVRLGLDPLLSLVPAAGTTAGAAMGSVVLIDALRLRVPAPVFLRMLNNYVIDWLLGLVPFIGAFFDVAYRSNRKNMALLERTLANRDQVRRATVWYWVVLGVSLLAVLALMIAIPVLLLQRLMGMLGG